MLEWLPNISDFRGELRAATAEQDPAQRLERLARLAQHRLSFLETIQLDRALGSAMATPAPGFASIRLAILASSTVDHLLPGIRIAGLRRRLLIDIHTGNYGQYRQELLDPTSSLHRFKPNVVLFAVAARGTIAALQLGASPEEAEKAVTQSVEDLRALWRKARDTLKAGVIQQTYLNTADPVFGNYDRVVPAAPTRLVARLNDRLAEAATEESVLLLDIARASERDGITAWFDPARWLQAKMEIAPEVAPLYGDLLGRILAAQRGLSKKCLVLDLDNTLWGGVIGDDGIEGIVLGEGSAVGEAHLALQRYAKQLTQRGIILAICSKNDPAIAEAAFKDHPEMFLKRADIAAFVANWNDKAENLKLIAERLNIGIDSLVFVDDNPAERARIRQSLPVVSVPEMPADIAHYVRCLAAAGYFEAISFTAEDRERAGQYAANLEREALLGSAESMDDFLKSLEMTVAYGPFTPVDLARVTQLINKTNQFNPTTRRYTAEDVAGFVQQSSNITLQFRLLDRFGDNGLVSTMILRPDRARPDILEIDSWVMSCRVFGRELENEAMNIAVETARKRGVKAFRADYIPTAKNSLNKDLYPNLGFTPMNEEMPVAGATRWLLNLADYAGRQTQIQRKGV